MVKTESQNILLILTRKKSSLGITFITITIMFTRGDNYRMTPGENTCFTIEK